MPRFIRRLALLLSVVLLATAAACGGGSDQHPTPSPAPDFPLTLQRSDGKSVTIPAKPARIVSLSPGATEVLFAIGAGDAVVGVDKFSDYPDAAAAVSQRFDGLHPNVEAIAALSPDLVFTQYNPSDFVASLDRLNVPVMYWDIDTNVTSLADVGDMIVLLGRLTGHRDEANRVAAQFGERVARVKAKIQDLIHGPTVYHELDNTFYSVSDSSFVGDLYVQLKAVNIASSNASPYPQLSQEAILAADPEVIVLADEAYGETPEKVRARPGWGKLRAVTANRIYALDPDIISRPGPRLADALEQLAKMLYPDRFP